jgi:purine nucleoside permease
MKTIIATLLILFTGITLNAQTTINSILASIEENNTTLKSLRESAEAQKLEIKRVYILKIRKSGSIIFGEIPQTLATAPISALCKHST